MSHLHSVLRRAPMLVLAALVGGLMLVSPAYAEGDPDLEADAAAAEFQAGNHVYVSADSGQQVDAQALQDEIDGDDIYIAVVPPNTPPADIVTSIVNSLQIKMTIVVISGSDYRAQSNAICTNQAQPLLDDAAEDHKDERATGDLTAWLTDYVTAVGDAPSSGDPSCDGGEAASGGGWGSSLLWIFGALLVGAGGGYLWLRSQKAKHAAAMESAGAGVRDTIDRLGQAIAQTDAGGNELAAAALQDARDRHHVAGDLIVRAEELDEVESADLAAIEGLTAVRYARQAQGQRVDFEVPALPAIEGEQLEHEQEFAVGDQRAVGVPNYAPGAPYYHPGGDDVPGGWYSSPIWDSVLIDSFIDDDDHDGEDADGGSIWDEAPGRR